MTWTPAHARASESGSRRSPSTRSVSRPLSTRVLLVGRTSARTCCPWARSARTRLDPRNPAAPRTRTFIPVLRCKQTLPALPCTADRLAPCSAGRSGTRPAHGRRLSGPAGRPVAPSGGTAPAPCRRPDPDKGIRSRTRRSEEHTSELQSRLHLVCRLLLEKKKKIIQRIVL